MTDMEMLEILRRSNANGWAISLTRDQVSMMLKFAEVYHQAEALAAERDRLKRECLDYENEIAAVCDEDYSLKETFDAMSKQIDRHIEMAGRGNRFLLPKRVIDRLQRRLDWLNARVAIGADIGRNLNFAAAEASALHYVLTNCELKPKHGSLAALLAEKREWSERTFGPGLLTESILAHVRSELAEIEAAPEDTTEHVDLMLLAMDLYWRAGGTDLLADLWAKLRTNQARQWQTSGDGAVEHVR